ILEVQERTSRQQRIGQSQDHVIRLTSVIEPDPHERQLGEPDGKVVVGAWKVGVPAAAAVFAAVAGVERPAEVEGAVEIGGCGPLRRGAVEPPAANPDPLRVRDRGGYRQDGGDERSSESAIADAHRASTPHDKASAGIYKLEQGPSIARHEDTK